RGVDCAGRTRDGQATGGKAGRAYHGLRFFGRIADGVGRLGGAERFRSDRNTGGRDHGGGGRALPALDIIAPARPENWMNTSHLFGELVAETDGASLEAQALSLG